MMKATNIKEEDKMLFVLDDNDPQFELEEQDKAGRYIEVYCWQTEPLEKLLTKEQGEKSVFEQIVEDWDLCEDDCQLNFYAEYYPYTKEVAIKYEFSVNNYEKANDVCETFDEVCTNTKDGYIVLTDKQKELLRNTLEEYLEKGDILNDFFEMDKEESLEDR